MKSKTLQKKIRRLERRLQQGPKKLAKWKRKLEGLLASDKAKARKKSAAKAAATRRVAKAGSRKQRSGVGKRPSSATKPSAAKKAKKRLNLSPERRAQLSAAMKARWAARRAAAANASPGGGANDQGFQVTNAVQ